MAIANTRLSVSFFGNKKIVCGKSVLSAAAATGAIPLSVMGLKIVTYFSGTVSDALTSACSVTNTFPSTASITIITTNNDDTVYWQAEGVSS